MVVQFTWSILKTKVSFLDVNITLENNTLTTSVHKTNELHTILALFKFPSLSHKKKTIPFSLDLRGQPLNSTTSAIEPTNNASRGV